MAKVAFDAGHGINTGGKRTPDNEREWSFNNKVVLAAIARLNTYQNVQILRLDDPSGKTDVPLTARTNKANSWGANVLVSIHHNANKGVWGSHGGVETFVHPTGSRASYAIAELIQPRIVKTMGLRNRGVKQLNLHMVRESDMPAVLTEGGFMDSTTDIGSLRSNAKLKAQGETIADGLAVHFGLKKKDAISPTSTTIHIVTGGLSNASLIEVIDYMKNKKWWGQITLSWDNGNPKLRTGGLNPTMRKEFETWLNSKKWWYKVE